MTVSAPFAAARLYDRVGGPRVMGILNVTPDSFSDGGRFDAVENAVAQARHMAAEGADIIDVGGESTRPGFQAVDADEEIARVVPAIRALKEAGVTTPISIDTMKAKVAAAALEAGAEIVNDVWGLQFDPDMARVAAERGAPVVVMHHRTEVDPALDIVEDMKRFLGRSVELALKAGVPERAIALDPGVGFGKTVAQNLIAVREVGQLAAMGFAVLLGTSRKSLIGHIIERAPAERVHGTVATSVIGWTNGATLFRVHDVRENRDALLVTQAVLDA
ncbi:dihydropteroate synthase [Methylopila jiangsuensis]|uniref:Dihydropteroate synthase n=1 Tax=Methylopila jiangsuensis TaxID=586230 RepID=A0A9W6N1Q3_9HYPH|nr:dihydropteroate synthase [Methylopila jiangsuensis]MDR6285373.1 dihydropteroate synthase [Methylopila jiangsuensis]GLK75129.1 dihydropteroate synthase [Methylopila jiangsuensis]